MKKENITNIIMFYYKHYIDVFVFYIFMSVFLMLQIKDFTHPENVFKIMSANIAILIATYILNKISDKKEDTINNNSSFKLNGRLIFLLIFLYLFSFSIYLLQNKNIFIIYWLILFVSGIFYSFPKKYRLKNIFIIKNIVPSFTWYISICFMFFSGFNNPEKIKTMYMLLPSFFLFFIFEIIWDLPDIKGDKINKIKTLPVLIGFTKTKIIITTLLLSVLIFSEHIQNKLLSLLIIIFVIYSSEKLKKIHYQMFLSFITIVIVVMHFYFN